jgi:hypothetical protein
MTSKKQSSKSLVIWDKESKFEIPGSTFIKSEEEFEKTKWSDFDVVYILAELGWKSRTEFYGFKVAKKLRLERKLTRPIVFCSFLSETQLYYFPESKILRRPGHYFVRLPVEKLEEKYEGIDEDLLEDINGDLFDKQEFIKNKIHDIKDILVEEASHGGMDVIDILKAELIPVKEVFCKSVSANKWEEVENELIDKVKSVLDKDGFQPYNLFGAFYSEDITRFIPENEDEISPEWPQRRWKVLFIDDKENIRNQVEALFFTKCNIVCLSAKNADEAFEKLKEDAEKDNLISVVISDYRLYENGDSKSDTWQELQGPQILKHIHYHPNYKKHYAYAVLTAKRNAIKRHISKPEKFHIHWFNKSDVLADGNHGFNLFCSRIIEIGSEAFYRKYETPDSAVWTNGSDRVKPGLSFYYRLNLESFDYEEAEKKIVTIVLAEIENIKNNTALNDYYEYQCSLIYESSNSNEVELLKKFRKNILIPRRIIWYLLNEKLKNADEIFEIFDNRKQEEDDSEKKKLARKKALYNTHLGISIKLIEWIKNPKKVYNSGMLSEETSFIKNQTENFAEKRSFITVDNDYIILKDFFDCLPEALLKGQVRIAFNKLINKRMDVDSKEIENCITIINDKLKKNVSIKEDFIKNMRFFYLSNDLYNKLNNQNLKKILEKVKF